MAEIFALPFDQLNNYRSHFKRIAGHTSPNHVDMPGLREARKLIGQYCTLVSVSKKLALSKSRTIEFVVVVF